MKKKVLLINFGDHKSIISSGNLISRISADERFESISLLVFEEYRSSALVLSNLDEILTLDRNSIRTLFNNKIYPKYFSLNMFMEKIERVKNSHFDLVVNYSGDKVASYVSGHLLPDVEICGSYYSAKNNICHTDEWEVVNEIAEEIGCLSFDRNDIYAKMMGLKSTGGSGGYVVREKHEKTVEHSLNKLRALNQCGPEVPKIIGVCVGAKKSMPLRLVVDFLREMRATKEFLPLVVSGTNEEDENVAKLINERFGHSLTLVKVDVVAAPSLLGGLDALICADTHFKCLADLVGTQVVQLSFGGVRMESGNNGSVVMATGDNKHFYGGERDPAVGKEKTSIKSSDMVRTLAYVLNAGESARLRTDSDVAVYRRKGDGDEAFYEKINDGREGEAALHRVMARNSVMLRFYELSDFDKRLGYLLSHNSADSLNRWINSERTLIANMMKDVLSVIRLVSQSQKDKGKARELVCKLDGLFSYERADSPVRVPIVFLRGSIFSMDQVDLVLKELYKTKNHLRKYALLVEELDDFRRRARPERIMGGANA